MMQQFEVPPLPKSIPQHILELETQISSNITISKQLCKPFPEMKTWPTSGKSFYSMVTGQVEAWCPTPLNSEHCSWLGKVERYKLVKDIRQGANRQGKVLSINEVTYACMMFEYAEHLIELEHFAEAMSIVVNLVRKFPLFTLGYYKLGLLFCVHQIEKKESIFQSADDQIELENNMFLRDMGSFFSAAVALEPGNRQLAKNIELILSVLCRIPTGGSIWDPSLCPKSLGDAICICRIVGTNGK